METLTKKIEKQLERMDIHDQATYMKGYKAGFDEARETMFGKESAKCIKCGDDILGDVDSLCGACAN